MATALQHITQYLLPDGVDPAEPEAPGAGALVGGHQVAGQAVHGQLQRHLQPGVRGHSAAFYKVLDSNT